MSGPDWFRWYPPKYASGVIGLTPEQRGVYMDIINITLDRGECPEDYEYLKLACNCQMRRLKRIVQELVAKGKIEQVSGKLRQKKAQTERKESENFSQTQRKRVQKRWSETKKTNEVADTILPDTNTTTTTTTTTEEKKKTPIGVSKESLPEFDGPIPGFLDRRKTKPEIKPEIRNPYSPEFAEFWGEYPKRLNASKKAAFEAWEKLLKAGDPPEEIIHGARCYAAYCEASGTVGKFVAHHQTWLNQARHREYAFDTPTEIYETTQRESHDNGSGKRSDLAIVDEASRRFLARGGE